MATGSGAATAAIKSLEPYAMLRDLNPTTRCYPRRLEDAFRDPIEQAQWFYPPERNTLLRDILLGAIGIVLWVGTGYLLMKG